MMVRERRGRTRICWWTICGGWSGNAWPSPQSNCETLNGTWAWSVPLGEPWRVGKRPYGHSALSTAAACLKGFYLHQSSLGINGELGKKLDKSRLPSRVDRRRSFLGHVKSSLPTNPLAPKAPHRRHPKMLPDGARERLLETVNAARDRLVVTWLADGGLGPVRRIMAS